MKMSAIKFNDVEKLYKILLSLEPLATDQSLEPPCISFFDILSFIFDQNFSILTHRCLFAPFRPYN